MPKAQAGSNTTDLSVQQGMHIQAQDGVIAKSPINPDTAEAAENAENKEVFDPRKAMMDAIVANRAKTFQNELDYAATVSPTPEQEDAEAEERDNAAPANPPEIPVEQPAQPAPATPNQPESPESEEAPTARKTIVVNGQNMEFTEDELVRLAQKGLSADERFREAARMRDEYNRALANAQGQHVQPIGQPTQSAAAQPTGQPQQQVDEGLVNEIARRINYGSEEEQKKAITDLINVAAKSAGRANQAPPADQLANVATQQALAVLRFEQNMDTIGKEFPDIFSDTDLTIMAARRVNELRMKYEILGTPKPDIEIYREAGSLVRDKYVKPVAQESQTSVPSPNQSIQSAAVSQASMAAKIERKRVAPQPPAAANKVASDAPQNMYPTGSQVVAQMRKARHQSAY